MISMLYSQGSSGEDRPVFSNGSEHPGQAPGKQSSTKAHCLSGLSVYFASCYSAFISYNCFSFFSLKIREADDSLWCTTAARRTCGKGLPAKGGCVQLGGSPRSALHAKPYVVRI